MNERERLAKLLYGGAGVVDSSWGTENAAELDVQFAYEDADAILAAGFGDKAEAWDEGFESAAESGWKPGELGADENPYRKATA